MDCLPKPGCFVGADYEVEVSSKACVGNAIVYQGDVRSCNFICLKAIQSVFHLTAFPHLKHILLVSQTTYMTRHLIQFLRRQLHTSSIENWSPTSVTSKSSQPMTKNQQHLFPKVIVTMATALSDLFMCGLEASQLALIIILESHDIFLDNPLKEIIRKVKELDMCDQPRILCLTSSLLKAGCSNEISETVSELQELCHSKLTTVDDPSSISRVMPLANDDICIYKKNEGLGKPCQDAVQELNDALEKSKSFPFNFNAKVDQMFGNANASPEIVQNTLNEIQNQMVDLGEYGGSIAAVAALRNLIQLNSFTDHHSHEYTRHMLNHLICSVSKFRKILEEDMFRVQLCERAERFSSNKIQMLITRLVQVNKQQRAIIAVRDPHSASIITVVLQNIVKTGKKPLHLKPELILNASGIPMSSSWMDILAWERNMDVYLRFIALTTNVVVLTGEPEGLDLPQSDIVLVLDEIQQFSEYICLKKYVKCKSGSFVLFCEQSNSSEYSMKIAGFQAIEEEMRKTLSTSRKCESVIDCNSNQDVISGEPLSFLTSTGKCVTPKNAISIIDRFCSQLSHDIFASCKPLWWKEECHNTSIAYEVSLLLPRILPLNVIKGEKALSLYNAKETAAFRACEALLHRNELNADLEIETSVDSENELGISLTGDFKEGSEILCDIAHPRALNGARPSRGGRSFVHQIKMYPVSERPPPGDNRKTVIYDLLGDESTFAIVSTKPMPKVCKFSVYAYGHEVQVELNTIREGVAFDALQCTYLHRFHCGLFMNVLPLVQSFMLFDAPNTENSFYLAPLTLEGEIDWKVIENHTSIPSVEPLTTEERASLVCTPETHERIIVYPWYRALQNQQVYFVASVCMDMCADSCFPTTEFETYTDYFRERYSIELIRPELPLLEVCLVNTKFNGLLPKSRCRKLRREEKVEDFREHMVPELCVPLLFPAVLWLKLASLPTVLHRLTQLLVVDDLRRQIGHEAEVGEEVDWAPFTAAHHNREEAPQYKLPPSTVKRGLVIGNVKLQDRKQKARLRKPWGAAQEPVDIYRHLETLNGFEICYYEEFLTKSVLYQAADGCKIDSVQAFAKDEHETTCGDEDRNFVLDENEVSINILNTSRAGRGPELYALLEAFTCAYSNDVVCMDRARVLGNSFLMLVVSVYLWARGPLTVTSKLSQLREVFLSREHLAQRAKEKNLCDRIKVSDFSPGDWIPPCFGTPQMLKTVLINQEINPSVLPQIIFSEEEQISGQINTDSEERILEILTEYDHRGDSQREVALIGRQLVASETASNCVEALLGTYLKGCGMQDTLKIIDWLQLFPSDNVEDLFEFEERESSPQLAVDSSVSFQLESLEHVLNYNFRDKELLAEAITHSSYVNSSVVNCMDRLVFLGEAILDFLLTAFLNEKCNHLPTSKLSSLRKHLTSQSTLAALAVRHNIHKFLLMSSSSLLSVIDRFVNYQEENQHIITDEICLLYEDHECDSFYQVELPSVLAHVLCSLAGAIYIDSGKNLSFVWNTVQKIFVPQIWTWKYAVPLSVVDLLMDLSPAVHQVIFSTESNPQNCTVDVSCTLLVDNTREEIFRASGSNEKNAKALAAKLALRALLGNADAKIHL